MILKQPGNLIAFLSTTKLYPEPFNKQLFCFFAYFFLDLHLYSIPIYRYTVCSFSCVQLFAAPWTIACQAPLSVGLSRQEYWSGLPCLPPGDLPDPGSNLGLLCLCCIGRQILYHCTTSEAGMLYTFILSFSCLPMFIVRCQEEE